MFVIDIIIPLAKVAGVFLLEGKLQKRNYSNMTYNLSHPKLWFITVKGSLHMTTSEV